MEPQAYDMGPSSDGLSSPLSLLRLEPATFGLSIGCWWPVKTEQSTS